MYIENNWWTIFSGTAVTVMTAQFVYRSHINVSQLIGYVLLMLKQDMRTFCFKVVLIIYIIN